MPELPDIENYVSVIRRDIEGQRLKDIRLRSIFLVRTVEPPVRSLIDLCLRNVSRLGKRLVFAFGARDDQLFLVLHLMIAGRLSWKKPGAGLPGKRGLCAFDFERGSLVLTEAGKNKRASVYVVRTEDEVALHDPGGLEILDSDLDDFSRVLSSRNHTLKRALTDPRLFSGIGGAYADEIMHAAGLSPVRWTSRLTDEESKRLYIACRTVLRDWTARIRAETGDRWPTVTAFRDGMAVHGRFGEPCPRCGNPVQRI
ncbi:MAG: DNA-formamidopyrimidine glycosylase family protein, partial [Rhodothermales bacterium]|nr:DNA-formamidopyrimidine glycosylase family protein [Rhodothermales bacterium]